MEVVSRSLADRDQGWEPPCRFVEVQLRGPYSLWEHELTFEAVGEGTLVRDVVRYALPLCFLGSPAQCCIVKNDLDSIYDYRARKVEALFGFELTHA